MARKRKPHERKLRTREHIIADLSINYVERQILLCGFSVDEPDTDYGIDLLLNTYNDQGEVEPGYVLFQVKATDSLNVLTSGEMISVAVAVTDLKRWQDEWSPVILVIYDAPRNKGYWLYVQQYLDDKKISADDFDDDRQTVAMRIPIKNRLGRGAIHKCRVFRQRLQEQMKGTLKHGG